MRKTRDLSGQQFGRLSAIERDTTRVGVWWICDCQCGSKNIVRTEHLTNHRIRSCGCLRKDIPNSLTHGLSGAPVYRVWAAMVCRTTNLVDSHYRHYGARGIGICERWLKFENFIADMGHPPVGLTLERKDNSAGYSPENCIWATKSQQARNTRRTSRITLCGIMIPLVDACARFGLKMPSVKHRAGRKGISFTESFYDVLERKLRRECHDIYA